MIVAFITFITPYIQQMGNGVYVLISLVVVIETLVGIGFIFPGSTLVVMLSFLCFHAGIHPWGVFLSALVGTLFGYSMNYYLGYYFSRHHKKMNIFFMNKKVLEKSKNIIHEHPIKSLILGRMTPGLKETIPFLSGLTRVPFFKFFMYSFIGTFLWGALHIGLPYIFSYSLALAELWIQRVTDIIFFILLLSGFLIYWNYKKRNK